MKSSEIPRRLKIENTFHIHKKIDKKNLDHSKFENFLVQTSWIRKEMFMSINLPIFYFTIMIFIAKEMRPKKVCDSTLHFGFKWLKPAKNKLTWSDFKNLFMQVSAYSESFCFLSFHALHIQNLSKRWGHNYFRQFHEFFNLIFGGFLTFGTTVWYQERAVGLEIRADPIEWWQIRRDFFTLN